MGPVILKLHGNIPTKRSRKRNCSNIISITSLHLNKSHVCSSSNQNKVLGQLSPLRDQLLPDDPPSPLPAYTALVLHSEKAEEGSQGI